MPTIVSFTIQPLYELTKNEKRFYCSSALKSVYKDVEEAEEFGSLFALSYIDNFEKINLLKYNWSYGSPDFPEEK